MNSPHTLLILFSSYQELDVKVMNISFDTDSLCLGLCSLLYFLCFYFWLVFLVFSVWDTEILLDKKK